MIEKKSARLLMVRFTGMAKEPQGDDAEAITKARIACLAHYAKNESHAKAVVEHLVTTLVYFPVEADIVQACNFILDPKSAEALARCRQCEYCHGDGFIIVDGPYGTGAAYQCDHRGTPNQRMGVFIPPIVETHYRKESIESAKRKDSWATNPNNPMNRNFKSTKHVVEKIIAPLAGFIE